MPPPPHAKPENVLKVRLPHFSWLLSPFREGREKIANKPPPRKQRAQELVAVNKNLGALELLHDHVTSKRTRNSPIASLEPVMILFVELCVSLRKGKTAKDGLYQYKNIAQNTSVQTIEVGSVRDEAWDGDRVTDVSILNE
jgi:translation initiation factor 3 subunit A